MIHKRMKTITALTLSLISTVAFADCKLEDVTSGWTGKITFKCDKDTNLETNPISFKLSDGKVGSVWGIGNHTLTEAGSGTVSITSKQWSGQPTIAKAGQAVSFSFSPSKPY